MPFVFLVVLFETFNSTTCISCRSFPFAIIGPHIACTFKFNVLVIVQAYILATCLCTSAEHEVSSIRYNVHDQKGYLRDKFFKWSIPSDLYVSCVMLIGTAPSNRVRRFGESFVHFGQVVALVPPLGSRWTAKRTINSLKSSPGGPNIS